MHYYGDGFPYFSDVEQAASEIGAFLAKWGRIAVRQTKEKYGTARVYCGFGWYGLQAITHPRYIYNRYPKWLFHLDLFYISRIILPFNRVVVPFHQYIYRLAYKRVIKKMPHIRDEIVAGADHQELLKGL